MPSAQKEMNGRHYARDEKVVQTPLTSTTLKASGIKTGLTEK